MKKRYLLILTLILIVTLLTTKGNAQTSTGNILGTITDPTDKVLPNIPVKIRNIDTGVERVISTNDDGSYQFNSLSPGEYEVIFDVDGFSKQVVTPVNVQIGSNVLLNRKLLVATNQDIIVVQADEAAKNIDTSNTVVRRVITTDEILNLPLVGRTFSNLAILVPGVKPVGGFTPAKARTGVVSVSGSSGRDLNVSVDGGDNKDNSLGGTLQNYTTESISQFIVETQNFLPETGRSAGGALTILTKSGTNNVHGSAFIFTRNKRFLARAFNNPEFDPLTKIGPLDKLPFDRQNVGGSLGGPIIKDKVFYFGALEYIKENISFVVDPTAVTELTALDVFARAGQIPGVSSVAALSRIPTPFRDLQFQIRTNINVSNNHIIDFRYGHQGNSLKNDQIGTLADITQGGNTNLEFRSALFNDTYIFNQNLVNNFSFQYSRNKNSLKQNSEALTLVFPSGVSFGRNRLLSQLVMQNKFQFKDALSIIKNQHNIKVGVDYVFIPSAFADLDFFRQPQFSFNANPSEILARGLALNAADSNGMALFVSNVIQGSGNTRTIRRTQQFSFFVQDSFRVNSNLTLNYGIRYDTDTGFYNPKGGSQATNRAVIALQKIGFFPSGKDALPQNDRNNFSPRVGIAYDPIGNGKAVIRASYGLFYDQLFGNVVIFAIQQAGQSIFSTDVFPGLRLGIDPLPPRRDVVPDISRVVGTGRVIDPKITSPYTQQASIAFEYEVTPNYFFNVQYVHILGLHQFMSSELNPRIGPLDPNFVFGKTEPRLLNSRFVAAGIGPFGSFTLANSVGRSRYDGFSIGIRKRTSPLGKFKYQYSFDYTLSRALAYGNSIGSSINDFGLFFDNPFELFRPIDLGRTNEDARHRAVLFGAIEMPFGFQASAIIQAESARRFGIRADQDINGDGDSTNDFARVDSNGNFIRFNPGDKITGRPIGVAAGAGVPYIQTDLRVTKTFKLKEGFSAEGYIEIFNLFNRANVANAFGGPTGATVGNKRSASVFSVVPDLDRNGKIVNRLVTSPADILPNGLFGSDVGSGAGIGLPFQLQFGFRFKF